MMSINKAQSGKKVVKKVVKTPTKKKAPDPNDDYKNMVDPSTGKKGTMGGEGIIPPFGGPKPKKGTKVFNGVTGKYDTVKKNGGKVTKAKNGKSFPDLNKDGKITKADILKGRGVIAKSGTSMKKAQFGKLLGGAGKSMLGGMGKDMIGGLAGKALGGLMGKNGKSVKKAQYGGKAASMVPPMKMGGMMKKGGSVKKKAGMHKMPDGSMMKNSMMKMGGKMKTCKGGC